MKHSFDQALRPLKLTHPQYVVLTITNAYGSQSGAELARMTQLTPQTVTVITRNLVRDRLLKREPDPRHRKVVLFDISGEGKDLLSRAREMLVAVEARYTKGLTPTEIGLLRAWLVSVAKAGTEDRV